MKNLFKEAHKITGEIKEKYNDVDYKAQFRLCLSFLNKKGDTEMKEEMRYEFEIKRGICEIIITKDIEKKLFDISTIKINTTLVKKEEETGARFNYTKKDKGFVFSIETFGAVSNNIKKLLNVKSNKILTLQVPDELAEIREQFLNAAEQHEKDYFNNNWDELPANEIIKIEKETGCFYIKNIKINRSTNLKRILYNISKTNINLEKYLAKEEIYDFRKFYEITKKELLKMGEEAKRILELKKESEEKQKQKREKEEAERINSLIEKAKKTGKKQTISSWMEPCNNTKEECNLDVVTKQIDKNGKIEISRQHTF
ncbi:MULTISPECIES: hypothetical protein [unclassified Clostridioides]|uniref:hypothetical protein n=1 Tax=unclassified Clostridioides TaxID=2635829 RepID=UPI001D11EF13|nr:hypothetical protein [Clostridioides sp. ZZV14-6153]MCC0739313.1 hypothetical protein [Clostridioides sp. ZZV14-5902]